MVSKAVRMAKASARGGFNLFWGLAASTVISAVGVILLARLLSPPDYGIVAIAMIAPNLITLFRDWGTNPAIIKYTAQYRAENKPGHVQSILTSGVVFNTILGGALTLLIFLLSGFLATTVFLRPHIEPLIQVASLTVFAAALSTVAQSAFIGHERMELYSATITVQATVKTILAPALVIMGYGPFGAILGTTIAFLVSGLTSITLTYLTIYRIPSISTNPLTKTTQTLKTMLKYGLPLSAATILSGFLLQFYRFLIAIYCADAAIGNYQVAVNFSVLITFFATPISTVLFPTFSKLDLHKETETLRNVFQFSVKYAAFLVAPAAAALIALSEPAITTPFGQQYTEAPLYLTLVVVIYLYSAFGRVSLTALLNGLGKPHITLRLTLIGFATGLPLSLLLIPRLGILGLIATTLITPIPTLIIGLWWVKKHFTITIDWTASTKILVASMLAATITYLATSRLALPSWIKLVIGTAILLATYTITTPLMGAITKTDIQTLRQMLSELKPLYAILKHPLNIMEKLTHQEQSL
jgi:O-antigen/teichoic acid export membrane protein